jgi:hypothetical protein
MACSHSLFVRYKLDLLVTVSFRSQYIVGDVPLRITPLEEAKLLLFSSSYLEGSCACSASRSGRFIPGKRSPVPTEQEVCNPVPGGEEKNSSRSGNRILAPCPGAERKKIKLKMCGLPARQ